MNTNSAPLASISMSSLILSGLCAPRYVHHHHLPLTKRRGKKVLDVGLEGFCVCGSLDTHRLSHPIQAHRGDQGQVLAPVLGHLATELSLPWEPETSSDPSRCVSRFHLRTPAA